MPLSRIPCLLPVLCLAVLAHVVQAAPDVRVVGLFNDRAVVLIDGKRRLLKAGQTSPEGVKLISATSESAVLEVDGRRMTGALDGRISARTRTAAVKEFQVWRDTRGMYTTVGSINGLTVSFLVDTGATQVAMNAGAARRLGIDYRVVGNPSAVKTASGVAKAWSVTLASVKVGDIMLRNIGAVVLDGAQPEQVLLGMSFLGRLEIDNDGHLLTLRQKY